MYAKPAPAKIIIAPAKVILKVLGGGGVGEETLLQKGPSTQSISKFIYIQESTDYRASWKRAVISFGKARSFFEAGVDSSVLDCFKKREATTPNGINQRFPRGRSADRHSPPPGWYRRMRQPKYRRGKARPRGYPGRAGQTGPKPAGRPRTW